jgi:predicted ATPase/DNA-binding winged helix-turn-helix (wHTH) protein
LGARTFDVLVTLIQRAPGLVSKTELLEHVWPGLAVEENSLRFQITLLRKALGDDPAGGRFISTVQGRGYCFVADVSWGSRPKRSGSPEPDLSSDGAQKTNLPQPLHPIIDRERELGELEDSLKRHRVVTVVGASGVGKTRLAVELGRRVLAHYPDGVWLVDLAPLSDPDLIASAAAAVLSLAAGATDLTAETLARRIGRRRLLLIFDNCEHLVDAVAALVDTLVSLAGGLTVLATSQETLRAGEEQIHALEPLTLAPAVSLFVERARRADRQFALSAVNADSVAEICRRLDGVPLALEMAAARLPMLGIEGLLSGLPERLSLLRGDPRRTDGRHASLRHVAAWSYGLLDEIDRKAFCRLAIFPGSFALDAAVSVLAPLGLRRWEAVDALWRLREKSLIVIERGAVPRYRLLETLRLYAAEQLRAGGDIDAVAEQHARHFADVLRRAESMWETMPDPDWIALYQPELDNLRAALDWALREPARREIALLLGGPGQYLLWVLSLIAEGRRYGDRLVPLVDDDTPAAVAAALLFQTTRFWQHSTDPAWLERSERAAALYRDVGDPLSLGRSLAVLGLFRLWHGQHEQAKANLTESRSLVASGDFGKARLYVRISLGVLEYTLGHLAESREHFVQSLQSAHDLRSLNEAVCLANLADLEFSLGHSEQAIARGREAVVCARATPGRRFLGVALQNLAVYLLAQGDAEEARPIAEEALSLLGESENPAVWCLQVWAVLGAFEGRLTEAAQLIGFVDAERTRTRQPQPLEQLLYDDLLRRLEEGLQAPDRLARMAEGAVWSEAEAVAFTARRLLPVCLPNIRSARGEDSLRRSQRGVVR